MSEPPAYVRARSVSDALSHLSGGGARVVAGGTDLAGSLQLAGDRVRKVVSIEGLEELRGISRLTDGGIRIGALTTLEEIAASAELAGPTVALPLSAGAFADEDLRRRATLGGNLCQRPRCWYLRSDAVCSRKGGDFCLAADGENSYHSIFGGGMCHMVHPSDTATALTALDARLRIVGPSGLRFVPIDAFFLHPALSLERETVLGHAEIVTDVLVPPPPPGLSSTFRRVSEPGIDYAVANVAVAAVVLMNRVELPRVVLGAAAPVPWRSHDAEVLLAGALRSRDSIERAAEAALAEARPLADNRYKVELFRDLLVSALGQVLGLSPNP